jgi:hypothetical protein
MKPTQSIAFVSLSLCVLSNLVASAAYPEGQFLSSTNPPPDTTELFGPVHIINVHSGKCLAVKNVSLQNNAEVVQYECDYSYPVNEQWYLKDNHIIAAHSGKCLAIQNASTGNNVNAVQYSCDYTAPFNENWVLVPVTEYGYHLVNQHSQKCLVVKNASGSDNANAVQYTCDTSAPFNEEWTFELLP